MYLLWENTPNQHWSNKNLYHFLTQDASGRYSVFCDSLQHKNHVCIVYLSLEYDFRRSFDSYQKKRPTNLQLQNVPSLRSIRPGPPSCARFSRSPRKAKSPGEVMTLSPLKNNIHPGRLTAGTYKFHSFRTEKDLNQTSVIMFHVNDSGVHLPGNEHIWGNGKPCSKVPW